MRAKSVANVLLLSVVWACYYRAADIANKAQSPFLTGFLIRLSVFVLLTAWLAASGGFSALFRVGPALPYLLVIGCMGFLLDATAFFGLRLSTAAAGTVLLKTDVLMVNLLSVALYKERLRCADWGLSAAMLLGVVMVLGVRPSQISLRWADGLFLLSALFVTVNAFLIRRVQRMETVAIANNTIAYYNNLITMLLFGTMLLFTGKADDFAALARADGPALAVCAGAAGQFVIYRLYYKALREMPVWLVKVILLLVPVCTLITGWLFFGERPDGYRLSGMAVVLVSACAMLLSQRKPTKGGKTA